MNIRITAQDIAQKFNVSLRTAEQYLAPKSKYNSKTAQEMREYAKQTGYYTPDRKCDKCGVVFTLTQRQQHLCPSCYAYMRKHVWKHGTNKKFYHNGCFHSREEEQERMRSMREEGYSNKEIAEKIGRHYNTVLLAIGYQPKDLTIKNKKLGQKIRAEKTAHRKQYVVNTKISEYNRKVDECKKKQEELIELQTAVDAMRTAIKQDEKRVTKLSKRKINPDFDLPIMQVTTLQ